jgi:Na+-translocating ferredoxin:NAD+ oxidoreductase RnfG subunit
MKRRVLWTVIALVAVSVIGLAICKYRGAIEKQKRDAADATLDAFVQKAYDAKLKDGSCKKRDDALTARVDELTREADAKLKIGTRKEAVVRFFAENGMPITFSPDEASGIINTTGCSPMGCGTDAAWIRLRVTVDKRGSVTSKPNVDGMYYIDCP